MAELGHAPTVTEIVERLQGAGAEVPTLAPEELEALIDDLPLALESDVVRDALPTLVSRATRRHDRIFRRIVEIARQDPDRSAVLLAALHALAWRGTPTENDFGWLISQVVGHAAPQARLAAYHCALLVGAPAAQAPIFEALASVHPDEEVRIHFAKTRNRASPSPAPEPAPSVAPEPAGERATLLRSLESVRVLLKDIESKLAETPAPAARWSAALLSPLSPKERARKLVAWRRELATPAARQEWCAWLLRPDPGIAEDAKRELLEFAFERVTFLGFDGSTRDELTSWLRDGAAARRLDAAEALGALVRATWEDGLTPQAPAWLRPIIDAVTTCLVRASSEERRRALGHALVVWLFVAREARDLEALDQVARDPDAIVSTGLFRALATVDLAAVEHSPIGWALLLGVWDRADEATRRRMAPSIARGWSTSFLAHREAFIESFRQRYVDHPEQRPSIRIVLAPLRSDVEDRGGVEDVEFDGTEEAAMLEPIAVATAPAVLPARPAARSIPRAALGAVAGLLVAVSFAGGFVSRGRPPAPTRLVIPGSGDSQDLLREVAKSYGTDHPGRRVEIPDSIGGAGGMEWAGKGFVEMGRTALRPSAEDQKKFGGLWHTEFARAPVTFVAHESVGVTNLTSEQVCALFSGSTRNWRAAGGPDLPVQAQARPDGSNLLAIRAAIPCFRDLKFPADAPMNTRNADLVQSIQTVAGAIGFMPVPEAVLHGFRPIRLDGVDPAAEAYPIGISLYLIHKEPLAGQARDFVNYLASQRGREILIKTGHAPIVPRSEPPPGTATAGGGPPG